MKKINQRYVLEYINKDEMLRNAFKYFLEHNTGMHNPYHNVNHTMAMIHLLISAYNADNAISDEMTEAQLKVVILAAIFHDMNHSGGLMNDEHNVDNAITAYDAFVSYYQGEYHHLEVYDYIEATQFPYEEGKRLTLGQKLIRECDNLCCFFEDFLTQVLFGLKAEMRTTDYNTLIENELKFLEYSWSRLTLEYSKVLIHNYGDELKDYLKELKKTISV